MTTVLSITVSDGLLARWRSWFAPEVQPFSVAGCADGVLGALGSAQGPTTACPRAISPELRDTFLLYDGSAPVWLAESEFTALDPAERRVLTARRPLFCGRRVWWPSTLAQFGDAPIVRFVEEGLRASRHRKVPSTVWVRAAATLPGARALAGTFSSGSGPNCFGTVMAACGLSGVEHEWVQREPFELWLQHATRATTRGHRRDDDPGTVLVWRDREGAAQHAAVTIGGGFALSKPSQCWYSPRVIWSVRETILAARQRGYQLSRRELVGG